MVVVEEKGGDIATTTTPTLPQPPEAKVRGNRSRWSIAQFIYNNDISWASSPSTQCTLTFPEPNCDDVTSGASVLIDNKRSCLSASALIAVHICVDEHFTPLTRRPLYFFYSLLHPLPSSLQFLKLRSSCFRFAICISYTHPPLIFQAYECSYFHAPFFPFTRLLFCLCEGYKLIFWSS